MKEALSGQNLRISSFSSHMYSFLHWLLLLLFLQPISFVRSYSSLFSRQTTVLLILPGAVDQCCQPRYNSFHTCSFPASSCLPFLPLSKMGVLCPLTLAAYTSRFMYSSLHTCFLSVVSCSPSLPPSDMDDLLSICLTLILPVCHFCCFCISTNVHTPPSSTTIPS